MDVQQETLNGFSVFHLKGRLDTVAAPDFQTAVLAALDKGATKILFDFKDLDYISSSGMRVLLTTLKRIKAINGRFLLCAVSEHVQDVVRLSGFDQLLDIVPTQEEALKG